MMQDIVISSTKYLIELQQYIATTIIISCIGYPPHTLRRPNSRVGPSYYERENSNIRYMKHILLLHSYEPPKAWQVNATMYVTVNTIFRNY